MNITPSSAYKYQVGGCLEQDAPSYVMRKADQEFYQALQAGEFCCVLSSPQTGKSSLRVQIMSRLQADKITCGLIDLACIGSHQITLKEFCFGIVCKLEHIFPSQVKARSWWHEREGISPVQRLSEFIAEVLLVEIPGKIVIFIDNIEIILKLNFKDDFFALLRACDEQRVDNPEYQRISFALFGVAILSSLIQENQIVKEIDLQSFQLSEVQPLAPGLKEKADNPQEVLRAILVWTGGQPFLTQKLCQLVLKLPSVITAGTEAESIRALVRSQIIDNWESQDKPAHLKIIRDRLLHDKQRAISRLKLYRQIWQHGGVAKNDSLEQIELQLLGLALKQENELKVANRIYQKVFNLNWIERELASLSKIRPYLDQTNLSAQNYQNLSLSQEQEPIETDLETKKQVYQRFAKPLLGRTRITRFSLTILIVSLMGLTAALVVANKSNEKLDSNRTELKQLENENELKKQEIDEATQQLEQLKQQLSQAQQQGQTAQAKRQQTAQALQTTLKQLEQTKQKFRQAQQQAQVAQAKRQQTAQALQTTLKQLEQAKQKFRQAQQQAQAAQAKQQQTAQSLQTTLKQLEQAKQKLRQVQQQVPKNQAKPEKRKLPNRE